jgi:hypothetical protein
MVLSEGLDVFDSMVDGLLRGEGIVAEFDSGIILSAYDLDRIGITIDEPGATIDIVISGEELEYLHLFLEALHAARHSVKDIDWDQLLTQNPDRNSDGN